ncbi:hypothetical protein Fcan01_07749 [Folsomia candida]|uniref:DUF7789 domain-containing protein n=1 Tax=Folsomia candida TaxID=158441 RepID=A0A226EKP6_FOLCA|nr:hypothetical protein Fcan01_07749 [Folsomia candida]
MSAAPYNDFEDSYTIVSSTSLPRRGGGDGSQEIEEISSLHSIILDNMLFYLRSILCLLNLLTGSMVAWKYWTIEQSIFKIVGTDTRNVMIFRNLFFGFSLMIFDMETSLVSLMLFLRNGLTSIVLHEVVVLSSGAIFLLIWIILGYKSMRSESRVLTWTFIIASSIQPAYLITLFIRNIKWSGSSQPVLTTTSHYMSLVALTVHLSVVAAVVVASHYYGTGHGSCLVFAIYFTFVGALKELPFQILMQLVTKIIIWIFNLIYFLTPKDKEYQEDETENEIRFYVSSSLLFLTVCVGGFVFYQYWTSNLSLFKTVGTEPKYVNMCRKLHLGQSLIILDVEITFVAVLLAASSGLSTNDLFALIVLPVGVLLVVIWACIGFFAMKKESRMLTYTFYILSHLQPVYVIYLLVRSPKSSVGGLLFNSIIVVAGLFFIIHVILLVTVVKIQFNYDKGLKQAAEKEIARTKSLAQSLNVSTEFIDRPSVPRHTEI